MTNSTEFAALVGSRICHDLISPVGAIGNGLELMGMTGASNGPELELISESVENANARIRFFRIAFGAPGEGQMVGASEIRSVLSAMSKGARFQTEWTENGDVNRPVLRMVFLAILCAETALTYGGTLTVRNSAGEWVLDGRAHKIRVEPTLWEPLSVLRAPADITPAHVQFGLLPLVAQETGYKISFDSRDDQLTLRLQKLS
ncbi:histidine phosphotransferase family protein [Shimia abyssi]|uniref:Histidine phosphotransferase ChpT n=1 Tax=Shimia abyssi TaxID=1662395 RepID=A0A2P8FCD8_9RHOB|nr:histidine phosphotransferase family protein [Shimia abyssi]PSL19397.1 histidine phosphotransferase ChpT [Shimia abyssi]